MFRRKVGANWLTSVFLAGVLLSALSLVATPVFATHAWAGYKWSYSNPAYHIDGSLNNLNMVDGSNPATLVNSAVSNWNDFSNFYLHSQDGSWGYFGSASLPSGALAETNTYVYPLTTTIYNSITNFNTNQRWADYDDCYSNPPIYNLRWVGIHEAGHWVRLEDVSDTSSVMNSNYYSGYASVDSHSKSTVTSIYG